MIPVKKVLRKTPVLKKPAFGCLKGVPAVNLTRGCLHRCTYCYARTFPETPANEVHLYANLEEKIKSEVWRAKARGTLPAVVTFSTASDLFQPHPEILNLAFNILKFLLENGLTVSFLTKGRISGEFWALFQDYPERVKPRFGLVSFSLNYHHLFEPYTASPHLRLRQIEKAARLGLKPAVRIDPVIPYVTDREEEIYSLLRRLKNAGAEEVAVSYLVLRPKVERQLKKELGAPFFEKIYKAYRGMPWTKVITSATTKLAQQNYRLKRYQMFKEIGKDLGLKVRICGCKNPDLPFENCVPWEITACGPKQQDLFKKIKGAGHKPSSVPG